MTIYDKFIDIASAYGSKPFIFELQDKEYKGKTFSEVKSLVNKVAQGLRDLGLNKGDHLSIMLNNGLNWVVVDLACAQLGIVLVPIHTTYNFDNIKHIITHSESKHLIIEQSYYEKYLDNFKDLDLDKIVVVGQSSQMTFDELLNKDEYTEIESVHDEDMHTLIYTSGTTGKPKGVMLSHKNIISNVEAAKKYVSIKTEDRFFSFLPLSHALERTAGYYVPMFSASSIYYATSPLNLAEEIKIAKPTVLMSVPRIFEKVYQKIMEKVNAGSDGKKKLFFESIKLKRKSLEEKLSFIESLKLSLLERLVLDKIRASLGGSLRFAVSGGASLDKKIARFFETLGILIIEGYGLTETSPIVAENKIESYKFGTVGFPLDGVEVKVSEDKEILVKGDNLMLGYYKNKKETDAAIDKDGWFHTGDLGFVDSEGFLTIIGRKKEMIVLSTGKNINPIPIEQALNLNRFISQSMVYGDKEKHLAGIIVPDFEELGLWLQERHMTRDAKAAIAEPEVIEFYKGQVKNTLSSFDKIEQVEHIILRSEEFTIENGLLTPTQKIRRERVLEEDAL